MLLADIIRKKIQEQGPISFRDFMEMALYYPALGYYNSSKIKIGKEGDFLTSSSLSSAFGAMIGRQIEEMWSASGSGEFTVVEFGAGTGALCKDLLAYLKNNRPLYDRLDYRIIEKSPVMREEAAKCLNEKVTWQDSIGDISGITGCILSNELLDNFSVHQVVMQDELMEIFVDYDNGFVEVLKPATARLKEYLEELNVTLPTGFRTEINLEATEWIREVANALKKGYVMTIDYGYPSDELYCGLRSAGTLSCYSGHTVHDRMYDKVGEQDITAHVNFSALSRWGNRYGLKCCGFTDQYHFLHALGLVDHLRRMEQDVRNKHAEPEQLYKFHTLLMGMGSKFKVLIQQKGLEQFQLSGLQFAQKLL